MSTFLRAEERYHIKWAPKPKTRKIGEIDVPMPVMPDDKLIKNIDKRVKDQKYTKELLPRDIRAWRKAEVDEYVKAQWHRRFNGEWVMIKGEPYYIPGGAVPFFDHWTLESGRKAEFRYSALELFWLFYNFVERNPNVFGIYDLKTRRIGDTANVMFMVWERCTRFRGARGGIQSYNDTMAGKTFRRLAKGAGGMPFYFQPNRTGSDREYLAYTDSSDVITKKKLKDQKKIDALMKEANDEREFISSFVDYAPTVTGAYDGEQMFMSVLDEILKVPFHRMDAKKQWNNLRRCLSLYGEDFIYGKGFALSTVEKKEKKTAKAGDDDDISTIEIAQWFWDSSDPRMLIESPDKRTVSGLVRVFRGYQVAAKPDEYGLPQVKRATKKRENKIAKALKYNEPEMLIDIFRKEPGEPGDALMEDSSQCPLYPEVCQLRMGQIKNGLDRYGKPIPDYRHPIMEGVLAWENNRPNSKVVFIPTKNGPWQISQMPRYPNKVDIRPIRMRDEQGVPMTINSYVPRYGALYRAGCDPISSNPLLVTSGSKGAIVIKRRLFLHSEAKKIEFDEFGVVQNPEDMLTNQIVADYLDRPRDPEMFFNEIVKACWFFSCPVMLEMDKPEAYAYLRKRGYVGMVMYEPLEIQMLRSRGKAQAFPGVRSKSDIVGMYVTRLQTYINNYWPVVNHPRVLKQWSRFVTKRRTKFDLAVASGMAEIGDMDNRYTLPELEGADTGAWAHNPFAI